jgi:outer membrane biosynthesis protein TonB
MNRSKPVLAALSAACALVVLAVAFSCSSGTTFQPIVLDASGHTPVPGVTPTVIPPPQVAWGEAQPPLPTPRPSARTEKKPEAAPAPQPTPTPISTAATEPPPPRAAEPSSAPSAAAAAAAPDSPGVVVAKHRQALDRGDVDAAFAMWAPDAVIESEGTTAGRDAIRRWLADQSATGAPTGSRDRVESGPNVAERLAGGGLAIFEVRGGRIVRARILR